MQLHSFINRLRGTVSPAAIELPAVEGRLHKQRKQAITISNAWVTKDRDSSRMT